MYGRYNAYSQYILQLPSLKSQQTTYRHLEDDEGEGREHDQHPDDGCQVEVRRPHHLVMHPTIPRQYILLDATVKFLDVTLHIAERDSTY